MKYDAVIFDLFGTLVDSSPYEAVRDLLTAMAEALGVRGEDFVRFWMQDTRRERARGAFPTIEANLDHICRELGIRAEPACIRRATDLRLAFTRDALAPRRGALPALRRLAEAGCKRGLVSDCSPDVPLLWPATPFAPQIDCPVFSCTAGLTKPDPRIYATVCRGLGVEPEACLFVGDGDSEELTGASRMGMDALLIRVPYDRGFRQKEDAWNGPRIQSLDELFEFVG